ncbi:MAG: FAD binding domain-containing protein [Silvibacterium sp.]|nr:FAD binding domain-containing protein [Silvibacterium sp.]MBV8437524.1 FAD binding domain-containing protein [Silvibacterium sp.]
MRSCSAECELLTPGSLEAVLCLLHDEPGLWTPIAGGTEIMVLYGAGKLTERKFVSIAVPELREITEDGGWISVGGGCSFTQIRRHVGIQKHFPMLAQCASWLGGIANQNRGTIGGNLANASPAADSPPALFAYGAELELISARGKRRIPYEEFHLGYKKTALALDELIGTVLLPKRFDDSLRYVRKVGTRNAQAISKICMAATATVKHGHVEEIRIGMGSVAPTPLRLAATERALMGTELTDAAILNVVIWEARRALASETAPIDDIRSTAAYRTLVAGNLLEEMLRTFAGAAR